MINFQTHVHGPNCHHDHDYDEQAPIAIHAAEDFKSMRDAGQLAAQTLDYIASFVKKPV